ncbi:hypothetical protein RQP46_008120 [Phenoliferia psychrophenolica]
MASRPHPSDSTVARPQTAAPPRTSDSEQQRWSDDEESIDDDPGMFSFLAPPEGSTPSSPEHDISQQYPVRHGGDPGGFDPSQPARNAPAGFQYPPPPVHTAFDDMGDLASSLDSRSHKRPGSGETGESSLKDDEYDRDSNSNWGIDATGMRADGMEMTDQGLRRPTRSEDEKMIAEFDAMNAREGNYYPGVYMDEEEDSPFPEVRASVSNYDDRDMPVLTFRAWFLGLFFASLVGALNAFFMFRYPAPNITPIIVQVLSFPCGKVLAWLLPDRAWKTPKWLRRLGVGDELSLNPGPFNIKEHTMIVIMTNAAGSPAFALNFSVASTHFFGVTQGITFDFLIVFTTCMVGFGVAGLCRRFLVWPASLIWPQNLVFCTLLNTLHAEEDSEGTGLSRFTFFKWTAIGAFLWYFLPENPVINQLFGVSSGLGMSLLTFDWSMISYIGNPLVVPWWAEANIFVGFIVAFWIFCPIMYYTNTWNSAYLPISSSETFDRFGNVYDAGRIVDKFTGALNVTAYHEYSPLYLPITYAAFYCVAFASATALITHTAIYHGREMYDRIKNLRTEEEDIHYKLMKQYPEVPEWWYLLYLAIFLGISIATVVHWDTQTPAYAVIVALVLGLIYVLPGGFIFAMTSQEITLNLIVDLVGGYMLPGLPIGNMMFKAFAVQPIGFALTFVQDLKLGHYMKVPPRATFVAQIAATLFSCILQVGVKEWLVAGVPDLCDPHQSSLLTCPMATILYSSSVVWGLVGPARQFGHGMMYNPILWSMGIGAVLPFPFWYLSRRYPNHWVSKVNIPVLLTGATFMPPATGINYSSWILVGFIFQYWARRRHFRWWSKFNFSLAAALDCGTALSAIVIFCVLQLPKGGKIRVDWWGNNVFKRTADWNSVPYLVPPESGFGITDWS